MQRVQEVILTRWELGVHSEDFQIGKEELGVTLQNEVEEMLKVLLLIMVLVDVVVIVKLIVIVMVLLW